MTDSLSDKALDRLMELALATAKPVADHIEKKDASEAYRRLADAAVYEVWEVEPVLGDGGLIEELCVRDGLYVADITEPIRHGRQDLPGDVVETCWVFRDHAHLNDAEIEVRCELVAILSPLFTDDRWLAVYNVEAA